VVRDDRGTGIFLRHDGSIVNIALPTFVRELATDFATVQWVVLAYLLTLTTLILGVGRLADMKGKKPIYITGFVVFTIGFVLCGLAPNVYLLIAFRVLQALGGTMLLALGMGILTEAFHPPSAAEHCAWPARWSRLESSSGRHWAD
jgi:MFS family permease